jgi:hypothetical protein
MDHHYKNLLLPAEPPTLSSIGRILRIMLMKAVGATLLLSSAWYMWYFWTSPIMDSYELIAKTKLRITGGTPSFLDTLREIVTGAGPYSYLADAGFYLSIICIGFCVLASYVILFWMFAWKREFALAAVYQSAGFEESRPDHSHRA